MGDGSEPQSIPLSQYEQDCIETALMFAKQAGERFLWIASTEKEIDAISRLLRLKLIVLRTVGGQKGVAYLLESTAKGHAVTMANWRERGD